MFSVEQSILLQYYYKVYMMGTNVAKRFPVEWEASSHHYKLLQEWVLDGFIDPKLIFFFSGCSENPHPLHDFPLHNLGVTVPCRLDAYKITASVFF
jgi:hypothetical protein